MTHDPHQSQSVFAFFFSFRYPGKKLVFQVPTRKQGTVSLSVLLFIMIEYEDQQISETNGCVFCECIDAPRKCMIRACTRSYF